MNLTANVANAVYNSLQSSLSKRFGHGLTFQVVHTYGYLRTQTENLGHFFLAIDPRAFREEGRLPANVNEPRVGAVRSASVILPPDADWVAETQDARSAYGGVEVAYVTPT